MSEAVDPRTRPLRHPAPARDSRGWRASRPSLHPARIGHPIRITLHGLFGQLEVHRIRAGYLVRALPTIHLQHQTDRTVLSISCRAIMPLRWDRPPDEHRARLPARRRHDSCKAQPSPERPARSPHALETVRQSLPALRRVAVRMTGCSHCGNSFPGGKVGGEIRRGRVCAMRLSEVKEGPTAHARLEPALPVCD